jgi:hypothetical protein
MSDERKPKVRSLGELPQGIAPPSDLWPQIAARLNAHERPRQERPTLRDPRWRWGALAASLVAALTIGVWIGRGQLPFGTAGTGAHRAGSSDIVDASYVNDPRYREQRAALLRTLDARLANLPPESRAKVRASLATIHQSMRDIQAALGQDPGNALLQELLIDTYQDEMRVLTALQDTGAAGGES